MEAKSPYSELNTVYTMDNRCMLNGTSFYFQTDTCNYWAKRISLGVKSTDIHEYIIYLTTSLMSSYRTTLSHQKSQSLRRDWKRGGGNSFGSK